MGSAESPILVTQWGVSGGQNLRNGSGRASVRLLQARFKRQAGGYSLGSPVGDHGAGWLWLMLGLNTSLDHYSGWTCLHNVPMFPICVLGGAGGGNQASVHWRFGEKAVSDHVIVRVTRS